MNRLLAFAAAAALLGTPVAAATSSGGGYAFGRTGGSIVPFTVTIAANGTVHATGPVTVGRTKVSASQRASLAAIAARVGFGSLPPATACSGTLPDIAAAWIRSGTHRAEVHGTCSPGFTRLWNALSRAVRLSTG